MNDFRVIKHRWLAPLAFLLLLALAACGSAGTPEAEPTGVQVGALAPDFSLPDVTGQTVSLSEYAGTPILLFFHMAVG